MVQKYTIKIWLVCALCLHPLCGQKTGIAFLREPKIKGLSFVAPPEPFQSNPMHDITTIGSNWIAVIPYGFSEKGKPEVFYNQSKWQWWGETEAGVLETIRLAKVEGLKVLLKPQVYIHHGWVGEVEFQSEAAWHQWENSYRNFICYYARIAEDEKLPMLCIATEFDRVAKKREAFFRSLIREIRSLYSGKLVYSANWDQYQNIPFWNALDFIGISAYFPLRDEASPRVTDLISDWEPHRKMLAAFSAQKDMPILFTEFGYLSVEGCAGKTWDLERCLGDLLVNQNAQANALEALFCSFWHHAWWAGGFLWKWYPEGQGHEGFPEKDYTPQGKMAMNVLQNFYKHP